MGQGQAIQTKQDIRKKKERKFNKEVGGESKNTNQLLEAKETEQF